MLSLSPTARWQAPPMPQASHQLSFGSQCGPADDPEGSRSMFGLTESRGWGVGGVEGRDVGGVGMVEDWRGG